MKSLLFRIIQKHLYFNILSYNNPVQSLYMLRNSVTKIVITILYSLIFTVYYTRLTK